MPSLPRLRPLEVLRLPEQDGAESFLLRDPEGYTDAEIVLSEAALFVVAHGDGEHTLEDVRNNFAKRYGKDLTADQVETVFDRLEAVHMLETDAFRSERERLHHAFRESPLRAPAHAGASYPSQPEEAENAVRGFFAAAQSLEESGERPPGVLRGAVAPHIDLRVGGPATALTYRLIAETPSVETVVVLGTSHGCPHPAWIVTEKAYETPLGIVPTDVELCRRLAGVAGGTPEDLFYHRREHSIEFQALFLAALRNEGRDLRMVPVLCGSIRDEENPPAPDAFLTELRTVLTERGDRVVVVAGADLAHVGPRFGDPDALSPEHLQLLEGKDRQTLQTVSRGDARAFLASVLEAGDPRRICGLAPIYALLTALPGAQGKLLRYEQATDPTGTVSYASLGLWGDPAVTPLAATPPTRSAE